MSYSEILDQKSAIKILKDEIGDNRISHAYLFTGRAGVGKKALAIQFAKSIFCPEMEIDSCDNCLSCRKVEHQNHPDLKYIDFEGESNLIKIDQIRELQKEIAYKPYESNNKVYIINHADRMTVQAANSLLKTLEEPPEYAIIILLAEEVSKMLPTVISRCQRVKLRNISREKIGQYLEDQGYEKDQVKLASLLADGSLDRAIKLAGEEDFLKIRNDLFEFLFNLPGIDTIELLEQVQDLVKIYNSDYPLLDLLSSWYRDIMLFKQGNTENIINFDYQENIEKIETEYTLNEIIAIIKLINEHYSYLERNIKAELVLQVMLLKIRAKRV